MGRFRVRLRLLLLLLQVQPLEPTLCAEGLAVRLCPQAAIESALAYGKCLVDAPNKFSCFLDKALVNVGADLTRVVPGRVST